MSAENDNQPLPEETGQESASEQDAVHGVIDALRAEADTQKDRALRAMAEVENVRKRLERERDEARLYAVTRFARDLLTVGDNLARALAAVPTDVRAQADDALKAVLDGIEATERELKATLMRHGVKPIEAEGVRFDPHLHQAIAEVPADGGAEPGTVMHVVQPGYMIAERLLRPAMVTVAKGETAPRPNPGNGAGSRVDSKI
jgi:molecular chaperone GrpE